MAKKYTKCDAIRLLKEKYSEILDVGSRRYPKRSDFTEDEVVAIKSYFGPWPRALEAAGIKPSGAYDRRQKKAAKQLRARRAKIAALKKDEIKGKKMMNASNGQEDR